MFIVPKRGFRTCTVKFATKNLKKFSLPNIRNEYEPRRIPKQLFEDFYNYPISRDPLGICWPGYWFKRKFVYVKEMEPELVVPDLTGFKLKPYVSYRLPNIENSEFTAEDLFKSAYGNQIIETYMAGGSVEFKYSPADSEAAALKHAQTGADLFSSSIEDMEKNSD